MTDVILFSKEVYNDTKLMDELMSIMGFYEIPKNHIPYKFVKMSEKKYISDKLAMGDDEFNMHIFKFLVGYNEIDRSKKEIIDRVSQSYNCEISSINKGVVYKIVTDNNSDRLTVLPGNTWRIAQ